MRKGRKTCVTWLSAFNTRGSLVCMVITIVMTFAFQVKSVRAQTPTDTPTPTGTITPTAAYACPVGTVVVNNLESEYFNRCRECFPSTVTPTSAIGVPHIPICPIVTATAGPSPTAGPSLTPGPTRSGTPFTATPQCEMQTSTPTITVTPTSNTLSDKIWNFSADMQGWEGFNWTNGGLGTWTSEQGGSIYVDTGVCSGIGWEDSGARFVLNTEVVPKTGDYLAFDWAVSSYYTGEGYFIVFYSDGTYAYKFFDMSYGSRHVWNFVAGGKAIKKIGAYVQGCSGGKGRGAGYLTNFMAHFGGYDWSSISGTSTPTPNSALLGCNQVKYRDTRPAVWIDPNLTFTYKNCYPIVPAFSLDLPVIGNLIPGNRSWEGLTVCVYTIAFPQIEVFGWRLPIEIVVVPLAAWLILFIMKI